MEQKIFIPFSERETFTLSDVTESLDATSNPEEQRIHLVRGFSEAKVRRDDFLTSQIASLCDFHDRVFGEAFATEIGLDYRNESVPESQQSGPSTNAQKSWFWGDLTPAQRIGWTAAVLAAVATIVGVVLGFLKPS